MGCTDPLTSQFRVFKHSGSNSVVTYDRIDEASLSLRVWMVIFFLHQNKPLNGGVKEVLQG